MNAKFVHKVDTPRKISGMRRMWSELKEVCGEKFNKFSLYICVRVGPLLLYIHQIYFQTGWIGYVDINAGP